MESCRLKFFKWIRKWSFLLFDVDDCFYFVRDGILRLLEIEVNVKGKLFVWFKYKFVVEIRIILNYRVCLYLIIFII